MRRDEKKREKYSEYFKSYIFLRIVYDKLDSG
jgi:hypothetical protein